MTKHIRIIGLGLSMMAIFMTNLSAQESTVFNSFGLSGIWGGSKHTVAQFAGPTESYMQGRFIGLEFGKQLFVGYSDNFLETDPDWNSFDDQPFDMSWRGGTLGYSFCAHRAIHPVINVELGRGKTRFAGVTDRIVVAQPSAGLEINVFRWLHLGLEGGYRFVSGNNTEGLTNSQLSGAFGQASLRFGFSWGRSNCERKKRRVDTNND
jgi:hypothetical protein